jgi:hypothetical protein
MVACYDEPHRARATSRARGAAAKSDPGGGAGTGVTDVSRRSIGCPIRSSLCVVFLLALAIEAPVARGQEPDDSASAQTTAAAKAAKGADHEDLAQKLQNPFADMISFPLQNITSLGIGSDDGSGGSCPRPRNCRDNVLNLQPVVPVHLTPSWNLLARPILPLSHTTVPDHEFGLGDLNFEPFLSPRKPASVVWGVGPILGFPTATGENLGTGKWTAGPSLAVFMLRGHWAFSLILNQQWSYAGDSARDRVSLLQIQPTLTYILGHGWFLTSGPLIAADWTEPSGQHWTVPLGGGVGRIVSIGKQKFNLQLEGYGNAIRPDYGPESMILLTVTFLFPH